MKSILTAFALFASLVLTDAHWVVMQSISWWDMSRNVSQIEGQSLGDIFSGKLTCEHCDAIQRGKDSEGEQTLDLRSRGGILVPVSYTKFSLPARACRKVTWPPHSGGLFTLFVPDVTTPPPWV